MNQHMTAAYEAIDHYLDDLTCELPADAAAAAAPPAQVEDDAWPPATTEYLICTAASIRVAIPMTQIEELLQAPARASDNAAADERLQIRELSRILDDDLHEPDADTLVVLNGWRWALACRVDDHEPSAIVAADVQWRAPRGARARRAWLGGLRKRDNCVLLDAVMLQEMLDQPRGAA